MTRRRSLIFGAVALALVMGAAAVVAIPSLRAEDHGVPTVRVTRASVSLSVHATGELRAGRTVTLVAPPVGGLLRLVRLVGTGFAVKAGDVVMAFDPSEQEYTLEQSRSELLEAEQEIVKMKADAAVQRAQDQVTLLTARYDVRRAELDALGNELIGAIDAKKNLLSLEEARRRLAQLETDVTSRAATDVAALAVLEEKRNKARLAMQRAEQIIDGLVIRSPIDGIVALKENRDAMGGMMFFGMVLPEYREGDTVSPGRPVAEVLNPGGMEIRAKVNENDRANLVPGQTAEVKADAVPGATFSATIRALSGLASRGNFWEATSTRQFDAVLRLDEPDPRLKPGISTRIVVAGQQIRDALSLPRQALFEKDGKPIVYARDGKRFAAREVRITHRTEARVVIDGVAEGTEVALVDPDAASTPAAEAVAPLPGVAGSR